MKKEIYFIRHGESESNVDGIYRGTTANLTERGREQARVASEKVSKFAPEVFVASHFGRAIETAGIIAEGTGLNVEENELFGEKGEATVLFGRNREEPEIIDIVNQINDTANSSGGHSDEEYFDGFYKRVREAMSFLEKHEASKIAVVTHGGFLRAVLGSVVFGNDLTKEGHYRMMESMRVDNTGIIHAVYDSDKNSWQIASWNN